MLSIDVIFSINIFSYCYEYIESPSKLMNQIRIPSDHNYLLVDCNLRSNICNNHN